MQTSYRKSATFQPNPALYPFVPHFLDTPGGAMHYVDEGSGQPILFVHGTPTWSFLYRHHIAALSKQYRCIAPDHIGFGLSDKPEQPGQWNGTLHNHSRNIELVADTLGLDNITLVVHDFGGPIALPFALRRPEKIRSIVLFNTWLWETAGDKNAQRINRLLHSVAGRWLYLCLNISPRVLLKKAYYDSTKLTKEIHRHYTGVFPTRKDRYGLLKMGQELVGASEWLDAHWRSMERIANKPSLLLWGMRDVVLGPQHLHKWQSALPHARTVTFDCGHFVQEEQAAESTRALADFMRTT